MDYVNLGRSGLKISRLALGCMTFGSPQWQPWVLDEAASRPIVDNALDFGINFFYTADMYSRGASEEVVGHLLKGVPRHKLVIASKLYNAMSDDPNDRGLSRKHIYESVDASLQRQHGWAPFVAMQPHYNLIYREEEREMLPLCLSEGIGVIPWSPLARGLLAGRRGTSGAASVRAETDRTQTALYGATRNQDDAVIAAVRAVAERHGRPMAQIAYAWVATRPGISAPIIGISKVDQFDDAIASLDVELSDEDVAELEAPYHPKAVAGHQ
jgi:aryl-alcohol dehydrogenase-like predicted oxidoreductase